MKSKNPEEKIIGQWVNEYGSLMTIDKAKAGSFSGTYSSTTGDTGTYLVFGTYDVAPYPYSQTVAFAITWKSITGEDNAKDSVWDHASSALSGQIQNKGEQLIMPVIHVLSSPTRPENNWQTSLVDKLTFIKQ